jgi:mannitol/fructose-specific phosphotransferase system IIA component (Ntr-type)
MSHGPLPHDLGFPTVELPKDATSSPEAVVKYLVQRLVERGEIKAEHAPRVICQVLHRESLSSTAIGQGAALPHSKSDVVERLVGLVGRYPPGMDWPGALDNGPVHTVCLLVTAAHQPSEALWALEAVTRKLRHGPEAGSEGSTQEA